MNQKTYKHILCAVRGRPESRETATRAIDLALEHQARLTFIHVIDAEFLGQATPTLSPLKMVYEQLEQMGKFAMQILCDRAIRRGVEQVAYILEKGNVPKRLREIIQDSVADALIIGRPVEGPGKSVFTPDQFDAFITRIKNEEGLDMILVEPDELDQSQA